MKTKLFISAAMLAAYTLSFNVHAENNNTVSVGYALSKIKANETDEYFGLNEDLKGFNVKYNRELENHWGIIGGITYTKHTYDIYENSANVGDVDLEYYSLTVGPSYRFNEYVSAYGLIGLGYGKIHDKLYDESLKSSKTTSVYGLGLQVNPMQNIAIDASYEYSKIENIKFGTWVLGVGYRF